MPQSPTPEPQDTPVVPLPTPTEATPSPEPSRSTSERSFRETQEPRSTSGPKRSKSPAGKKRPAYAQKGKTSKKKKRRRPSPIPVSMWLVPRYRLPFSNPLEFLRWFFTGINFWAIAAVILCVFGGYHLIGALTQPRLPGVEQALSGGEATAGLAYTVTQTGDQEVTVTGTWPPEEDPPAPELAAAVCAALSPEEIYGHSDHLYQAIASRFFEGEPFDLTIIFREQEPEKPEKDYEPPEPIFTITRKAGAGDWPQPECAAAFARQWRETYNTYWLFGQGRKEDLGPPQSDPIIEEGDLPPEGPSGESGEEDAPPLPDLNGEGDAPPLPTFDDEDDPASPGSDPDDPPDDPSSPEPSSSSDGGSSSDRDTTPAVPEEEPQGLEKFFQWVLEQAKKYRQKGFEESASSSSESR